MFTNNLCINSFMFTNISNPNKCSKLECFIPKLFKALILKTLLLVPVCVNNPLPEHLLCMHQNTFSSTLIPPQRRTACFWTSVVPQTADSQTNSTIAWHIHIHLHYIYYLCIYLFNMEHLIFFPCCSV